MGYVKGSIDLSSTQDGILLQQVLRSRHATHDQLWQFLQLKAGENRRRIFNWRMLRLVQHGLITRLNVKCEKQGWVYAISEAGAAHLAGKGDGAAFVAAKAFKQLDDPVVPVSGVNSLGFAQKCLKNEDSVQSCVQQSVDSR